MAKYQVNFLMDCGEVSTITLEQDYSLEEEQEMYSNLGSAFYSKGIQTLAYGKQGYTMLVVNMDKVQSYLITKD